MHSSLFQVRNTFKNISFKVARPLTKSTLVSGQKQIKNDENGDGELVDEVGGKDRLQGEELTVTIGIDHLTARRSVQVSSTHDVKVITATARGVLLMGLVIRVLLVGLLALDY